MNGRHFLSAALVLVVLLGLGNWAIVHDLLDIGSGDRAETAEPRDILTDDRPLVRIGVVSRFAPNVIYAGYQPIMDYLTRHGSARYELRLSTSYQDAVDRLRRGEVAASFLGAWIYSRLATDSTLVPLVAPVNAAGVSAFHTALVTRAGTGIDAVSDLAGRRVALPSRQSWSGNWLRVEALPALGMSPADLDSIHHFDHHQTVAWQVLRGDFDAGVVKESVAGRLRGEGLRCVALSAPFPGPPLVGNVAAPAGVLREIRALLVGLEVADATGRAVPDTWSDEFAHGFTAVEASSYRHAFRRGEAGP